MRWEPPKHSEIVNGNAKNLSKSGIFLNFHLKKIPHLLQKFTITTEHLQQENTQHIPWFILLLNSIALPRCPPLHRYVLQHRLTSSSPWFFKFHQIGDKEKHFAKNPQVPGPWGAGGACPQPWGTCTYVTLAYVHVCSKIISMSWEVTTLLWYIRLAGNNCKHNFEISHEIGDIDGIGNNWIVGTLETKAFWKAGNRDILKTVATLLIHMLKHNHSNLDSLNGLSAAARGYPHGISTITGAWFVSS